MTDAMKAKADMRLLKCADSAPNFDDDGIAQSLDEIRGMIYGINGSIAVSIENADVSYLRSLFALKVLISQTPNYGLIRTNK